MTAGNVLRLTAGQIEHQVGHLIRLTEAFHDSVRHQRVLRRVVEDLRTVHAGADGRPNRAGVDRVDANAQRAEVHGGTLGDHLHCGLARRVDGVHHWQVGGDARRVDDVSLAPLQVGHAEVGHLHQRAHIEAHQQVKLLEQGRVEERAARTEATGVVEENVNAAVLGHRFAD